jgi:riboflavin transporter FmnP
MSKGRASRLHVRPSYRVARISALAALSVIGSFIHLPGPFSTISFDSSPGFFAALFFGAGDGALVCAMGHLATSIVNGFPLGALHLPIAIGLAAAGGVVGSINKLEHRLSYVPALIAGVTINTSLVIVLAPSMGWAATLSLVPFLLFASIANVIVAGATYVGARGRLRY